VFRSFLIRADEGGIMRSTPGGGVLIEEYPHAQPDYTLNGWTTATLLLDAYAQSTGDEEAHEVVSASRKGLREMLPLYDVPQLANSRYRLAGPAHVRWTATGPIKVESGSVIVPGQGEYEINRRADKWRSYFGTADEVTATARLLLSRATFPEPNRAVAIVDAAEQSWVTVQIGQGTYNPMSVELEVQSWADVVTVPLHPGQNRVEVRIPWDLAELVAYPTSFGKAIGGWQHNQYHYVHIDTLQKLDLRSPDDMFSYYSSRWRRYVARWPDMPEYQMDGIKHGRHDDPAPESREAQD
jgi:hypothetical protein